MTHDDWTSMLAAATDDFARHVRAVDPASAVPACPGWTVADLVDHVGGIHQWARHAIVAGTPDGEPAPAPAPGDPAELASWYAGHAAALRDALADAGPEGRAWTFGTEQTGRWWLRRQLHETVMHTRDLLEADGRVGQWQIDPALAWDGVAEVATEFYPRQVRLGRTDPVPGTLRLVPQDVAADPVDIGTGAETVVVTAPATDVLLMLWRRAALPADAAALVGERALAP